MKVKKKIFNECVLPVMTYGSETWALNKVMEEMMIVAQWQNGVHHAWNLSKRPKVQHLDTPAY